MAVDMKKIDELLNERVKLKSAVIGVGYAGSFNAQRIHEQLNIPAFIINSSVRDLSNEVINGDIPSFVIGNEGRGAANDRDYSKQLFAMNKKELFTNNEVFKKMIDSVDIVFVLFSTAGGTGSGSGPELIRIGRKVFPLKIFIPIVIAPRKYDSPICQYNNLHCIDELDKLGCSYMIADLDMFSSDKEPVAYEKISDWIIQSVKVISGATLEMTQSGMMDENDLQTLISEPGYMVQYTIEVCQRTLENTSIESLINKYITSSPAMFIQKDKRVKWGGLIVNVPEDIEDPITRGDVTGLIDTFGEPKHFYKNFSTNREASGKVTVILSGLTLPYNRLSESKDKLEKYNLAEIKSKRDISLTADLEKLDTSMNSFSGFRRAVKVQTNDPDLEGLFD